MKSKLTILAAILAASSSAFGTVTLSFSNGATGISSNFANAGGVVSNNLFYGILVDGNNDGYLTEYGAITPALSSSFVLTTDGGLADDVLYIAEFQTGDTSIYDDTQTGGNGGLFTVSDIAFQGLVGSNDSFRVVWFDTVLGTLVAGTLADASFVLPSDGFSVDLTAPFVGTDPTRTAGLAYSGTSANSTGPGLTFVPEPSSALLGALGALGLLRRRRN